ncbi:MAG TPA: hypothetical protein VK831_02410 [Candidatus Deferrimicrobiaceae bacterium]|nr:hypothetical protein [Candidatus Deferrimicrobiaceae bacterium]
MSTAQKRGFRLPWSSDRTPEDPTDAADRLATFLEAAADGASDSAAEGQGDLGEGPFRVAPAEAQNDVTKQEAAESEAVVLEGVVDDRAKVPEAKGTASSAERGDAPDATEVPAWPASDRPDATSQAQDPAPTAEAEPDVEPAVETQPEAEPETEPVRAPRRDTPLVAGLVKAMREAAETSRGESIAALRAEATAHVETIRSGSTDEEAALRKQADADVAEIREWAKAEAARIRTESEERIADRQAAHALELEAHAEAIDARVAEVEAAVSAYEAEMGAFFERLLAEDDPARLATLAERAPDPPILADLAAMPRPATFEPATPGPAVPSESDTAHEPEATSQPHAGERASDELIDESLGPEDAAAAEAQAFEDLEIADDDGNRAADAPGSHRMVVTGLTTVAGISAFKGAIGQLEGVQGVSVTAGERGTFVFAIAHDPALDLESALPQLPGFDAKVTGRDDDAIRVAAHEPAA